MATAQCAHTTLQSGGLQVLYLGVMISSDGSMDSEVKQRKEWHQNDWGNWENSAGKEGTDKRAQKVRVVNAMVILALTYGYEAWTL